MADLLSLSLFPGNDCPASQELPDPFCVFTLTEIMDMLWNAKKWEFNVSGTILGGDYNSPQYDFSVDGSCSITYTSIYAQKRDLVCNLSSFEVSSYGPDLFDLGNISYLSYANRYQSLYSISGPNPNFRKSSDGGEFVYSYTITNAESETPTDDSTINGKNVPNSFYAFIDDMPIGGSVGSLWASWEDTPTVTLEITERW